MSENETEVVEMIGELETVEGGAVSDDQARDILRRAGALYETFDNPTANKLASALWRAREAFIKGPGE